MFKRSSLLFCLHGAKIKNLGTDRLIHLKCHTVDTKHFDEREREGSILFIVTFRCNNMKYNKIRPI